MKIVKQNRFLKSIINVIKNNELVDTDDGPTKLLIVIMVIGVDHTSV